VFLPLLRLGRLLSAVGNTTSFCHFFPTLPPLLTLVHYLYKALFIPTKSTMLQAVKDGHLITWPGLTEDAINIHLKLTPATVMGHMNQRRQNIRSTSKAPIEKQPTTDTDLGTKTHLVYAVVVDQGQLYTGLTGKFPVRSSKGNSYVMVCYVYDCNYVKVIPMKSRSASKWVKAYDTVHQELTVFEEFLHRKRHRLPIGAASLPSPQRRGTRHPDLQRTLCGRALLS
jgi:hypothetical protein